LENIESTAPERNRYGVDEKLAPIREQLAVPEPDDACACFGLWHGRGLD
jgi:hypothetical protein